MNGSTLTLGLVGALAAVGALSRRGSRARSCPPGALIFYHGAHRWEGPPSVVEHRKGHAEYGPGIYLTTNWETANEYAKGGGSVYRIGLDPSTRFSEDVQIEVADARSFVKGLSGLRGKADILAFLDRIEAQRGPKMYAEYLVNAFVNRGVASGKNGPMLAAFLAQQGADASLVSHSMDEDWVVVFNPDKVCMVERLDPKQVSRQGFAFSLPNVARSRGT